MTVLPAHQRPGAVERRLYISDLDGTLLGRHRGLGERTRRVLERFVRSGGLFTVATGRSAASCSAALGGLELPVPAITHNGALTCELGSGAIAAVRPMAGVAAADLFARALGSGLCPVAYGLDEADRTWLLHAPGANPPTLRYIETLALLHPHAEDDGARLGALRGLSLILLDEPARLAGFLAEACGAGSSFASSLGRSAYTPGLGVAEVQAAEASKGAAAGELARTLGLAVEDIVAFGDNCNDLPLLRLAGQAFCPPDAQREVLEEVGGRIGRAADEGVAAFLEDLLDEEAQSADRLTSRRRARH